MAPPAESGLLYAIVVQRFVFLYPSPATTAVSGWEPSLCARSACSARTAAAAAPFSSASCAICSRSNPHRSRAASPRAREPAALDGWTDSWVGRWADGWMDGVVWHEGRRRVYVSINHLAAVHLSIYSAHPPICLSTHPSFLRPIHKFTNPRIHPSIHPPLDLYPAALVSSVAF